MRKTAVFAVLCFFVCSAAAAEDNIRTYRFKFYTAAEGKMVTGPVRPNFGYRIMSTFPLHVKEFTFPAPYIDHNHPRIKKTAEEEILTRIVEWRQKNAYHIVNAVYDYIANNIDDREVIPEVKDNLHKVYYSGVRVLREKRGNNLEKCRAAVALLRYFTIPARMVGYKDR